MSPRDLRLAVASFVLVALALMPFGCGLSTSGIPGDSPCTSCSDVSQCKPPNECMTAACNAQSCCEFSAVPDGDSPNQTPGDCQRITCAAGASVPVGDIHDIEDDGEQCTYDDCSEDGTALHSAVEAGTPCNIGAADGTCDKFGKCSVLCSATEACPSDGQLCTEDICDIGAGTCDYQPLHGVPVPGVAPVAGDCRIRLCVNGKDESVVQDTDLPVDGEECTQDICNSGTPGNPPLAVDTPCAGMTKFCDGGATCGECNVTGQCYPADPPDTFCGARTCTEHVCGKSLKPSGTAVPVQTDFDCNDKVCDGVGGEKNVANDLDKPEDNNPCTVDLCTSGVPQHTNVPAGTSCGPNSVCGANGQAGQCVGCNGPTDCPGTDDFCKTRTCLANVCGYSFTADGTAFPPANQTPGDCLERQCNGAGNEKQAAKNADLPDDGNNCTNDVCTMGAPSNPPKAAETPCTGPLAPVGGFCDGMVTCYACNLPSQCPTPPVCMTNTCASHTCGQTPTGSGTPIAMQTPHDCKLVVCDGAGGLMSIADTGDIPDDSNACTQDSCNGTMPVNTILPAGTPCGTGMVCDAAGLCGKAQGQPCSMAGECAGGFCADLVCCSALCNTTCQGCTFALTNVATGTCANIKPGTEDAAPACNGPNACDGMGNCKFDNGQACSSGAQCVSGSCADGVCCNNACGGTCQACTAALTGGATGTCGNVLIGVEDTMPACNGVSSCDGFGNCKKDSGQTCATAGECSSGFCADGVCCNVACGGVCKACTAALNGGTTGTCGNILNGSEDTAPPCNGTMTCDGSGSCKKDIGQPCSVGSECASGSCPAGTCA